jgi:DNA helicase-2/ATP-dependent DNA helicase PcrA
MVKIITRTGLELNVTDDNKTMVTIPDSLLTNQSILYKNKIYVVKNIEDKRNITNDEELESLGFRLDMPHGGNGVIKENGHTVINAMSAVKGMIVSIYDNDRLISDVIESVEIIEVEHPITVYDINLDKHHNFIANNVLSHNCIYEWRGSDPSIILSVGPTFDMRTFVLSTNYRCKSEIVDYATTGIKCNSKRYAKSMKANVSGGTVKIAQSAKEDLCSLSILAMNQIKYWIDQGDSCKDIAVLSRNNFHLALLSNMLLREGIYCNMTEDMKLTKSYMYKDIRQLITISEPSWKPEITANVLWKLCRYMSVGNARVIANFQNNSNLSLSDTLGYLIKHFINKGIDFNKAVKVSMQAEEQMKYYMGRMSSDTIADLTSLYELLTCGNRDDCLRGLMEMYRETTVFIYKSSDKKRSLHGLCLYIRNLLIKDGFDKMVDFLRITEQFESGNMGVMGEKVTLTTIHSAKGREWKNVIMFGCDNISQPSFDGLRGMEEDGIAVNDIFESIDEERRLFYVGNTRAKENLFVITYKIPSVFILEALGIFGDKDEPSRNNGEILEYVNDNNRFNRLQERILDMLAEKGSKYHYDPEDYKLK